MCVYQLGQYFLRMGNESGKPSELMGSTEPVTNFGINIKQPDKLHLVRSF